MNWCQQRDSTIEKRLNLFKKQKENVLSEIARLQETLNLIKYKEWYYTKALSDGTEKYVKNMPLEEMPKEVQEDFKNGKYTENKELMIIPNAVHTDLYDKTDIIICISIGMIVMFNRNDNNKTNSNISNTDETNRQEGDSNMNNIESLNNISFNFKTKKVKLNSGYEMPILGLGTWTQNDEETANSVYYALEDGYRLIDTAQYYGNEKGVGDGLNRAINDGIVTREEVFITTKIMPSSYNNAYNSIDNSLEKLGVDYIDLLLIHQPGSNDEAVYKAMEQGVQEGKVKSIGISNYYTKEQVDEVLSYATITPAVIQNENHIYYQNTELQNYVSQYGIIIESWYPFGGRGHTSENFNNETIKEIAKEYNKTSAQIILRWQLQAGYIVIPGSSNPDHIAENYDVFNFELSEEDMKNIANINKNQRYENW